MTKEEIEKEAEEYDLVIRFKSNKPKYEIRSHIINHTLNEFDNLQMWDFKRSSEFAEPREKRIAELEEEKQGLKDYCDKYTKTILSLRQNVAELERKLEQTEKDLADYQFNYPTIKELEAQNKNLQEMLQATRETRVNADYLKKITELEAQIEKMKYCGNCRWEQPCSLCDDCKRLEGQIFSDTLTSDNWELRR